MPNKKPKVVMYLWPELMEYAEKKLGSFPHKMHGKKMTDDNLDPSAEVLSIFVESPVTKEMIARMPRLKCIATLSTGFDHIDLVAARQRGIVVSNVPTYGEHTVAEHTFALILALTRRIVDSVDTVKKSGFGFGGVRGVDLYGKTLGVVGTGHIGTSVIRIAKAFGMRVVAYDKNKNHALAKEIGFSYVPLASLLKKSDIVTLHTPLFKETYHSINKQNSKLMKQGSYLINTARGGLADPEAVLAGLESGRLAGVGLDVLEEEMAMRHEAEPGGRKLSVGELRAIKANKLIIRHPNALITPHNAFNSVEALKRIIDVSVDNIWAFTRGIPQNVIK